MLYSGCVRVIRTVGVFHKDLKLNLSLIMESR